MELDEGEDDDEDVAAPKAKGNQQLNNTHIQQQKEVKHSSSKLKFCCVLQNHLAHYESSHFLQDHNVKKGKPSASQVTRHCQITGEATTKDRPGNTLA